MARPRKEVRIKRNGDSLQLWDSMGYAGSISINELCVMLRGGFGTREVYKETGYQEVKVQNKYG